MRTLALFFIIILTGSVIPVFAYTIVPPTPAFSGVSNGTTNTQARFWNSNLTITHGPNMLVNIITANNTIYFESKSGGSGSGGGTYNVTQANGVTINSGGLILNFRNGTNNPVHVVNSGSKVNITISDTAGTPGITSLNFTTNSDFDFNILPRNMSFIKLVGQVFNFYLKPNIVTTNESAQTVTKQLTLNNLVLGGDEQVGSNALSNLGHKSTIPATSGILCQVNQTGQCGAISPDIDPAPKVSINGNNRSSFTGVLNSTTFKVNNITCTNQFISAFSNSTGLFTCSTPTISINGLSRSVFTGIIANQTFPAPKVVINTVNSSSFTFGATSPISISNSSSSHTITCTTCLTSSSSGIPVMLGSNLTSSSTSAFTHVWTIPLTANTGNTISGVLVSSSNTAGAAIQVGANMSSISTASGSCTFHYASTATAETFFSSLLTTTSSDSAWTVWLSGANQAAPITFVCAIQTGSSAPTLQINFQAEVASTVSMKANSFYQKTP